MSIIEDPEPTDAGLVFKAGEAIPFELGAEGQIEFIVGDFDFVLEKSADGVVGSRIGVELQDCGRHIKEIVCLLIFDTGDHLVSPSE